MRFSKLAARKAKLLLLQATAPRSPAPPSAAPVARPEMVCFRGQTLALVRHFFELSSQLGRLPSLLGREFFRARVTHHAVPSFEEQAVFIRDVERCLSKLSPEHHQVITLAGLYDFSQEEVAEILHTSRAAVHLCFSEALDSLSELLLQAGLLCERRPDRRQRQVMRSRLPDDVAKAGKKPPRQVKMAARRLPDTVEMGGPGFDGQTAAARV